MKMNLMDVAQRYSRRLAGQPENRAIPQLPPGLPQTPEPRMRFNPNVPLDPSQVEDRRGQPYDPGPGGYDIGGLLDMFSMMLAQQRPQRKLRTTRRG